MNSGKLRRKLGLFKRQGHGLIIIIIIIIIIMFIFVFILLGSRYGKTHQLIP